MSGADRYQEAYQHLAAFAKTDDPSELQLAEVQSRLALAAATVLPLVVQHMGDTDAITDWARMIAPDLLNGRLRFDPAVDRDGYGLWLTGDNYIEWAPAEQDDEAPEGWRRLYVKQRTDGRS